MSRIGLERPEIPEKVKEALRELAKRLGLVLGEDYRLYLFGSYARGDWIEGLSDIDVVVVSSRFKGMQPVERAAMVRRLARKDMPFEILCYTPEELERLIKSNKFIEEISGYWMRIH